MFPYSAAVLFLLVSWSAVKASQLFDRTVDILFDCYHIESADLLAPIEHINYEVTFHPYFLEFPPPHMAGANTTEERRWTRVREPTFYTRVRVTFDVTQAIYRISLHAAARQQYQLLLAKVLPVNNARNHSLPEPQLLIVSLQLCEEHSLLTVHFNRQVKSGERIQLDMTVFGNITTPPFDVEFSRNSAKLMIITEPIFMRRVFPCFDEPHYRGHFRLHVLRQRGLFTLSNMPRSAVRSTRTGLLPRDLASCRLDEYNLLPISFPDEVFECDEYEVTEYTMSTYLFSVYVGTQRVMKSDLRIRPDLNLQLYYSANDTTEEDALLFLNHTSIYIDFFENYFNSTFPGSVMHNVIVNMSMGVGAETWNIVGYKSSYTSMDSKLTIAHEVVHHWIGNLISISSWKYLWMKESTTEMLTRLYGYSPHYEWPEAREDRFAEILQIAFLEDVFYLSNFPIEWPLCSKADVDEIFSWRTYEKGALILYALQENLLEDPEIVRSAFQTMIHTRNGTSVTSSEFWEFFNTSGVDLPAPLAEIMNPFFRHPRFPVVVVRAQPNENSSTQYTLSVHFETFRLFPSQPVEDTAWKYLKVKVYDKADCIFNGWLSLNESTVISHEFDFSNHFLTANLNNTAGWHATLYPWQIYEVTLFSQEFMDMASTLELTSLIIAGYERNLTTIMRLMILSMERDQLSVQLEEDPYPAWPARAFTIHPFLVNETISLRFENYFRHHSRNYSELMRIYGSDNESSSSLNDGVSLETSTTFKIRGSVAAHTKFNQPVYSPLNESLRSCQWQDLHRLSSSTQEVIVSNLFYHFNESQQREFLQCYLRSLMQLVHSHNTSSRSFKEIVSEDQNNPPDWLLIYLLENIHTIHMARRTVNHMLLSHAEQPSSSTIVEWKPSLLRASVQLLHVLMFTDRINFIAGEPWCSFIQDVFDVMVEEPRFTEEFFIIQLRKNIHVLVELALAACNLHGIHGVTTSQWLFQQGY